MGLRDLAQGLMGAGKGLKLAGGAFDPQVFSANVNQEEQLSRQQFLREENMTRMNFDRENMITGVIINAIQQGAMDPAKGQALLQRVGVGGVGPTAQTTRIQDQTRQEEDARKTVAAITAEVTQEYEAKNAAEMQASAQRAEEIFQKGQNSPEVRPLEPQPRLVPEGEEGQQVAQEPAQEIVEEPQPNLEDGMVVTGTPLDLEFRKDIANRMLRSGNQLVVEQGMKQLEILRKLEEEGQPKDEFERTIQNYAASLPTAERKKFLAVDAPRLRREYLDKLKAPRGPLVQNIVGGMTPTDAAKTELINQGISDMQEFKEIILPDGKVNKQGILNMNVPGFAGLPGTEARTAYSLLYNSVEAKLRAESGAAVPEAEVQRIATRFMPSPLDSDDTVKSKISRLEAFLRGSYKRIKNAGPPSVGEVDQELEPETVDRRSPEAVEDELRQIEAEIMRRRGK